MNTTELILSYIENLIFMESIAHHWHFQTNVYDKHKIFDELYENLPEHVDTIGEVLMSKRGQISSTGRSLVFPSVENAIEIIDSLITQSKKIMQILDDEGDVSSKSAVENLCILLDSTKYKLSVLVY